VVGFIIIFKLSVNSTRLESGESFPLPCLWSRVWQSVFHDYSPRTLTIKDFPSHIQKDGLGDQFHGCKPASRVVRMAVMYGIWPLPKPSAYFATTRDQHWDLLCYHTSVASASHLVAEQWYWTTVVGGGRNCPYWNKHEIVILQYLAHKTRKQNKYTNKWMKLKKGK
jgi:hypothetical protein